MFYSGYDPRDLKPVFTEHDMERKQQQKAFFFKNSSKKSEKIVPHSKNYTNIAAGKRKQKS